MTSRTLVESVKFRLERRVSARSDGKRHEYDVVVHPGAVVVLPVLDERQIVMIRNYRYTIEQELWELPAGTMEAGEPAEATARRELEEETGYSATGVTLMTEFYTSPGFTTELMRAYVATDLKPVAQRLEANEKIVVEVVELERARRMLLDGRLRDGKTIATLATYLMRAVP